MASPGSLRSHSIACAAGTLGCSAQPRRRKPDKKRFKVCPIGYFHIDIAEVSTARGKLRLFVGIDRTSKFAVARLVESAGKMEAAQFLRDLAEAVPYTIHTVLTDNGIQFTSRARNIYDSQHVFDRVCNEHGIEHRLTKANHPRTNGQVERMNRTLKDATVIHLYQFCLRSCRYGSWEVSASSPDVTLAGLKLRRGARFAYRYDLNIPWRHEVRIEENHLDAAAGKASRPAPPATAPVRRRTAAGRGATRPAWTTRRRGTPWRICTRWPTSCARWCVEDRPEVLKDQESRWRLEDAVERSKARERARGHAVVRRAVNAQPSS